MKIKLILILTVFLISCKGGENVKTIEYLKIWYYNGIFERITSVDCDEIVYIPEKVDTFDIVLEDGHYLPKAAVILESIITDKNILKEIESDLSNRINIDEEFHDSRMKCYILFNNGQKDSLCVGDIPTYGFYNGQSVKLTKKLIYLLRRSCGFYRWINIDYLKYFDELNDSTFVREKVKAHMGEYY